MKKTVQYFTKEYLDRCRTFTPEEIIEFIENYRNLLYSTPEKCQQINIKIEPSLLNAFKKKAELQGVPYQTMIKQLMKEWVIK